VLVFGLHTAFEVWIVILKRREYLEVIAINGTIEMLVEGIVMLCELHLFGCKWRPNMEVQNILIKYSML
jgi:hypothetical protein